MSKEYSRMDRIAELIQREIAILLQREMPELHSAIVTVTHVVVSRDLSQAKIYITQHAKDPEIIKETVKTLNESAGHLRYLLAHAVKLRVTPQLKFFYDADLDQGLRLSALIDKLGK